LLVHSGTFELLSEIAIAVAGFAGVAAAFGGRDRSFEPIELVRLTALFQYSGAVLGGCFGLLALVAAGLSSAGAIRVVSIAEALIYGALAFTALPRAYRLYKDASTVPGRVYFVSGTYAVFIPLLIGNGAVLASEWPLIVVFAGSLLMGLWLFHGLLTKSGFG
jgi:hypothetical protein